MTQDTITKPGRKHYPRPFGLWAALTAYVLFYLGIAGVAWLSPTWLQSPMVGEVCTALSFSFVSLWGIWASLGFGSLRRRLAWAAAGVLYCAVLWAVTIAMVLRDNGLTARWLLEAASALFVFSLPAVGVAATLFVVRRFRAQLALLDEIGPEQQNEAFQFSLHTVMAVMVALALLWAMGRSSQVYDLGAGFRVFFAFAFGVLVVLVALAAVWATLGLKTPLVRLVAVALATIVLGATLAPSGPNGGLYVCPTIAAVELAGLLGPLLLVRSCGYRLVRRPPDHAEQEK